MAHNKDADLPVADVETIEDGTMEFDEKTESSAYKSQGPRESHRKTKAERSLLLKADFCIIPLIALLYLVSYLDRNNIGNARLMGWENGTNMTDAQYYNVSSLFFVGYIIFMFPANTLVRYIQPQRMIGGGVIAFGILVICMSAATSYGAVLALRILVGCFQCWVQSVVVYTPYWYKRDEIATRAAIYYSAATLSGAFSGLIAYGVQLNLNGVAGRSNWQWLFIIEGSLAVGVGVIVWLLLPPFPDQIKNDKHWLFSKEEIKISKIRAQTYNALNAKIEVSQIWATFIDPKTYFFMFVNTGVSLAITSVGIFLPSFINAFGFSPIKSQLFSVIPYACAFVTLIVVSKISDWLNRKFIPLICCLTTTLIGYIILITVNSTPVKIFAACLIVAGSYPCVILNITWLGINTGGFTKRAVTWSVAEMVSNSFAIMGAHVYVDPPKYIEGHSVLTGFTCFSILNAVAAYLYMARENKERDRVEQEYQDRGETHPDADKSLEQLHDHHAFFRYTL